MASPYTHSRAVQSRILLIALALACSSPTSPSGGDQLSFQLDGQVHVFRSNTEYLSMSIAGPTFSLIAADATYALSLEFALFGYTGPATYGLGEPGQDSGRLAVNGVVYHTAPPEGQGSLTISSVQCSTKTTTDPVTGITGPVTTCHAQGTFGLNGVSETGTTAVVTGGRFKATSVRGGG
jgi:hypothetical protein